MNGNGKKSNYRVGIYVRESRDENEENYDTIETQRDLLLDYIDKNEIGKVTRVYIDDNVSGSGFERRGIQLLKKDIAENAVDLIIMKDLSRLGRNNAKTLLFLDYLEENGVRVLTCDGKYDSLKDNDTVGIETWFNERYIRDISKKIRTNLRFKILKGEYIGKAPFGYVKSSDRKNSLCIDNETAFIIKKIFKLYLQGYGFRYIAERMNREGYPSPAQRHGQAASGSGWNAVAVRRILSNRVYIGDTVQGVSEKISFKSKKTRRLPEESWVITQNTHEPIVSREEFNEVQSMLEARSSKPHKGELHLFRGMLYCGRCGSMMYGRVRKSRPMGYICGNYGKKGRAVCSSHYITEKELEDIVRQEIISLSTDKDALIKVKQRLEYKFNKDRSETKNQKERLEQLLLSKLKQQDILYIDKLEGRISERLFTRTNSTFEARICQIKNELASIENTAADNMDTGEIIEKALAQLEHFELNREIIRSVVKKVIVLDSGDDLSRYPELQQKKSISSVGAVVIDFLY
ncbi:MAG: recombinase family protein [Bacillota bacterium]|nr:recombinase family protein [Bacillota bacterium]